MALWVPSPNKYNGRVNALTYIVWHSTESSEVRGGAHNIAAGWFARPQSQASSHIVADDGSDARYPDGIIECVKPRDTAWHASNANSRGYGIELIGKAYQGAANWRDAYSLAAIRNACRWIRNAPELAHIPARWLTDAELRAGNVPGHTTHAQCSRVLGGDHTDPGPDFPADYVMELLGGAAVDEASIADRVWRTGLRLPDGSVHNVCDLVTGVKPQMHEAIADLVLAKMGAAVREAVRAVLADELVHVQVDVNAKEADGG